MCLGTLYTMFKKIIRWHNATIKNEDDILPEIPLRGLRHTSTTPLISQNVDIRTVSGRLSHAQTDTTTDIYSHFLKCANEAASDSLENLFNKPQKESLVKFQYINEYLKKQKPRKSKNLRGS